MATEQEEEREKLEALRKAWDERERTLARIQHDISLVDKEISLLVWHRVLFSPLFFLVQTLTNMK